MTAPDVQTAPFSELTEFDFRASGRDVAADARTVQARVDAFLGSVPDEAWDRPVAESAVPGAPPWALRDHVGHLADWNDEACRYIQPLLDATGRLPDEETYDHGDIDGWNERRRPLYAQRTPAELRAWHRASADRLLELARRLSPDAADADATWEWVWHNLTSHPIDHVAPAESLARPTAAPGMAPVARTIRYLSRAEVEAAGVSMAEVIDAVEAAFANKGAGAVELPAKTAVHPGSADSFIHAMPASIPAMGAVGVKWIAGFPENQSAGLPYINGLLLLNEPATGIPTAVMDATWITATRTAAASAVSARRLARPDSERLAIVACGVQGMAHLEALPLVLPSIRHVAAFDPDEARATALVEAARARGLEADVAATAADAVRDADVIVTSGPILHEPHATLGAGLLQPGAFVSAVDFDSYWHASAFAELDVFTTDDIAQLEHFRSLGYFRSIPPIDADLGELVTGAHPGRTSPEQRTMACNLGVAIDDVAVGVAVLRAAERAGIGTLLAL